MRWFWSANLSMQAAGATFLFFSLLKVSSAKVLASACLVMKLHG